MGAMTMRLGKVRPLSRNGSKRTSGETMAMSSNSESADASTQNGGFASARTPCDEPPAEQEVEELARPSSALALLTVFRHRNYRLFFSGQLVSLMGTWMQSVAQAWLVYRLTHDPRLLGLTAFAAQVTVFFMASFGGMIADRVDRRRMLLVTQAQIGRAHVRTPVTFRNL